MRGSATVGIMVAGLLASGTASADWTGKATFGGVLARGNTDTSTVNAVVDFQKTIDRWTHKFGGSLLRTVTNDVTSADRWELRAETNYDLDAKSYLFGTFRYEDDAFTDYSYQATLAGGFGYRLINTETTRFDVQVGVGYRSTELRITGETSDDPIARGAINFERNVTATTLIYDRFLVEAGSDNTFQQNALGIEVKITDVFALGLDYSVRHNTDVLPGTEKTDQVVTANLVYSY